MFISCSFQFGSHIQCRLHYRNKRGRLLPKIICRAIWSSGKTLEVAGSCKICFLRVDCESCSLEWGWRGCSLHPTDGWAFPLTFPEEGCVLSSCSLSLSLSPLLSHPPICLLPSVLHFHMSYRKLCLSQFLISSINFLSLLLHRNTIFFYNKMMSKSVLP